MCSPLRVPGELRAWSNDAGARASEAGHTWDGVGSICRCFVPTCSATGQDRTASRKRGGNSGSEVYGEVREHQRDGRLELCEMSDHERTARIVAEVETEAYRDANRDRVLGAHAMVLETLDWETRAFIAAVRTGTSMRDVGQWVDIDQAEVDRRIQELMAR